MDRAVSLAIVKPVAVRFRQAVDQAGLRQQVQCAIAAEEGGGKSNGSRGQEEDNLGGIGEQERRDQEEDQKGEREQPGAAEVHRKRGGGGGTGGKSYCSLREKAEGSRAWRYKGGRRIGELKRQMSQSCRGRRCNARREERFVWRAA